MFEDRRDVAEADEDGGEGIAVAMESRKYGDTEIRTHGVWNYGERIAQEMRIYEFTESRTLGLMEYKKQYSSKKKETRKYGGSDSRNQEFTEQRTRGAGSDGNTETRTFGGTLKPLMSEAEKEKAQVLELSYDFSWRIIRLYKYLNEGKLSKADRDIIDALGRQLVRSATSINANMNEAQHPQSDSDFLSKASIALKESRESETWLHMLSDNGYLDKWT